MKSLLSLLCAKPEIDMHVLTLLNYNVRVFNENGTAHIRSLQISHGTTSYLMCTLTYYRLYNDIFY